MLPSVQIAPSAGPGPAEFSADLETGTTSNSLTFHSAMVRALANEPELNHETSRTPSPTPQRSKASVTSSGQKNEAPRFHAETESVSMIASSTVEDPVDQSDSSKHRSERSGPAAKTQPDGTLAEAAGLQAIAISAPMMVDAAARRTNPSPLEGARCSLGRSDVDGQSTSENAPVQMSSSATDNASTPVLASPVSNPLRPVLAGDPWQLNNTPPLPDGVHPNDQRQPQSSKDVSGTGLSAPIASEMASSSPTAAGPAGSASLANFEHPQEAVPQVLGATTHRAGPVLANGPPLGGSADPGSNPLPQSFGISAAQQESLMKKAEKLQKIADVLQQNLPGHAALSAGQNDSMTLQAQPLIDASPCDFLRTEARLNSIEKTHDLVALHALRLGHSNNEELKVVIEPGSGTRLSLEMRFKDGVVEAQAVLQRGDYEFLNQHWAELQHRLEPRGVHLSALETSTHSSPDDRRSAQQNPELPDETSTRTLFAQGVSDVALLNPVVAPPSKLYAGWQTWA